MDRATRLFIANALIERTRTYTKDAVNDLLETMDGIERHRNLIPKLSLDEEAIVREAEEKLARGETLPELEILGPIEDFLPEPEATILARLDGLPRDERDHIFAAIALLIDIDAPPLKLSPGQIANLRRRLRNHSED